MLDVWPYVCDPDVAKTTSTSSNGTKLYCAAGSPDQVYGEVQLDGMRFIGSARAVFSNGFYGVTPDFNVSPSSNPLTGIPFGPATYISNTPLVVPAQCKSFNLICGADLIGIGNLAQITHRIGFFMWPKINGVVQLGQTGLYQSTQFTIGGAPGLTMFNRHEIAMNNNPESIMSIGAGVATTVEIAVGMFFGAGAADGVQNVEGLTASMRTYIQFV